MGSAHLVSCGCAVNTSQTRLLPGPRTLCPLELCEDRRVPQAGRPGNPDAYLPCSHGTDGPTTCSSRPRAPDPGRRRQTPGVSGRGPLPSLAPPASSLRLVLFFHLQPPRCPGQGTIFPSRRAGPSRHPLSGPEPGLHRALAECREAAHHIGSVTALGVGTVSVPF